jgi:hypothetical protein
VSTTVATDSATSARADHPPRPTAVAPFADRGPLFSANEKTYLTRRAEPKLAAGALGPKSREDAEAAFWLWRGLAGDRPMLDYTREEADDLAERLDVVPTQLRARVTIRPRYACRRFQEAGVQQAPGPARIFAGGLPTEALLASSWW